MEIEAIKANRPIININPLAIFFKSIYFFTNFGEKSLTELREKLAEQGITNPYMESDSDGIDLEAVAVDNASVNDMLKEEEN